MAYADKTVAHHFELGASVADNTDVSAILVPGGKELQVKELSAIIRTGSPTSNALMELVDSANTVVASVSVEGSAGDVNRASQTATSPVIYTNPSATADTFLKLRTDQDSGAGCDVTIQLEYTYPGSYAKA